MRTRWFVGGFNGACVYVTQMQMGQSQGEEEEVDDEDMGVAETYADYMPSKRMFPLRDT